MKFQMAMVFHSANNKRKEILKSQENRSICFSFFSVEVIVSTRRDPVVILKFSQGQSGRLHGVLFHVLYSGELWATLVMDSQTWWLVPHPREWWPSLTHYKVSVSTPLACLFFLDPRPSLHVQYFFFQGVRLTWNTAGRFSGVKDFLTACQQWLVTKRKRTGLLDTKWQGNMTKEKDGEIQS